jgi:hypothetical protein
MLETSLLAGLWGYATMFVLSGVWMGIALVNMRRRGRRGADVWLFFFFLTMAIFNGAALVSAAYLALIPPDAARILARFASFAKGVTFLGFTVLHLLERAEWRH